MSGIHIADAFYIPEFELQEKFGLRQARYMAENPETNLPG